MPSLYDEFCRLQPELAEINQAYSLDDAFRMKLYWLPFRKTTYTQCLQGKVRTTYLSWLADGYLAWGISKKTIALMQDAIRKKKPLFYFEDPFIRSLYNNPSRVDASFRMGMGFSVDLRAPYYCGDMETDLEKLIRKQSLSDEEKIAAEALIRKIVENNLSKYNNQPLSEKVASSSDKRKILVIGQNYGDMSLVFGGVRDDVFETMIHDAINAGGEVYFKTHPDMIALGQQREFQGKLHVLDKMCNPISLLRQMDEVYVATSQMGFEALMLGKKVTVYGKPFYAGWGLTEDKQQFERRNVKKSLEEVFSAAYLTHPKYVLPGTSQFVSLDAVLNELLRQRQQHFGF